MIVIISVSRSSSNAIVNLLDPPMVQQKLLDGRQQPVKTASGQRGADTGSDPVVERERAEQHREIAKDHVGVRLGDGVGLDLTSVRVLQHKQAVYIPLKHPPTPP